MHTVAVMPVWFSGSFITDWQKKSWRGSTKWSSAPAGPSSLTQSTASLHRGLGARRSGRAEVPLPLSTDPSPSHWTPKLAVMIAPPAPRRPARFSATKIWGASRRRPRGGRKGRVTIQVPNYGVGLTIGKMIFSKHPELIKIFLHKCLSSVNMAPTSSFNNVINFLCASPIWRYVSI